MLSKMPHQIGCVASCENKRVVEPSPSSWFLPRNPGSALLTNGEAVLAGINHRLFLRHEKRPNKCEPVAFPVDVWRAHFFEAISDAWGTIMNGVLGQNWLLKVTPWPRTLNGVSLT